MLDEIILEALQTQVAVAVAGSIMPTLPVKYMMTVFDPSTQSIDGKWLEVIFIPNNITDEFWGEEKTYRGIFKLLLHWPMNGGGAKAPLQVINSVSKGFKKGTQIENQGLRVRLTDHPNLTNALEQPPESLFPVSIKYLLFTTQSDSDESDYFIFDGDFGIVDGDFIVVDAPF